MKVAVTGHTKGIGREIANFFAANATVVGLSRSNGYDINNIDKIVKVIKDCDIFINNAYSGYQQVILLETMYNLWKDTGKTIVSIGSVITDYPRTESAIDSEPWSYREHKLALQKKFRELAWTSTKCQLALINPGSTDTELVKHLECVKLSAKEVAIAVDIVLNKNIKEITLYAK